MTPAVTKHLNFDSQANAALGTSIPQRNLAGEIDTHNRKLDSVIDNQSRLALA